MTVHIDPQPEEKQLSAALRQAIASYLEQYYVPSLTGFAQLSVDFAMPKRAAASKTMSLEELLRQQDAGFSRRLLQLIDQSGKKDPEVYKRAQLSKQHFSKLRNDPDYKPTKTTALALALALELDLPQTRDLIGRAGYALSNSSKFDLIIRYCIENRIHDIVRINLILYEFDQPLL